MDKDKRLEDTKRVLENVKNCLGNPFKKIDYDIEEAQRGLVAALGYLDRVKELEAEVAKLSNSAQFRRVEGLQKIIAKLEAQASDK